MVKIIIKRFFKNKKNKQISFVIPKRKLKAIDPTLKFNEDLFVELEFKNEKGGKKWKRNINFY